MRRWNRDLHGTVFSDGAWVFNGTETGNCLPKKSAVMYQMLFRMQKSSTQSVSLSSFLTCLRRSCLANNLRQGRAEATRPGSWGRRAPLPTSLNRLLVPLSIFKPTQFIPLSI
jgi:hypothetical protein